MLVTRKILPIRAYSDLTFTKNNLANLLSMNEREHASWDYDLCFYPLTPRSDQYVNSSKSFITLSSKRVMRIKRTRGYCLDKTLNSQD